MSDRPTPLLRLGPALLKLELLQPGRAVRRAPGVALASAGTALAAAAVARGTLVVVPRGVFTHEVREALTIWGARVDAAAPGAVEVEEEHEDLCAELLAELETRPALVVAPAGDLPALLAVLAALRDRWPGLRGVALIAATGEDELPDLPQSLVPPAGLAGLPEGVEAVPVTRAEASAARARLARELGLLAGHASAAAAAHALEHGGLALLFTPGEREFSLDRG